MKVDQRQALATLNMPRLRELAVLFELDAPARRKDDLIDLLARSRRASFERILGELKRDELKAICRGAELDDSGREKALLADRILGREEPEPAVASPAPQPSASTTSCATTSTRPSTSTSSSA